ncbi:MAG TPA: geranylgeranyl reductase family protein [Caldimonas sp.]|nr:geranylgeranyl reductase family protein [Caldimonas sp.]HEX4236091.1 geranylgeranyl reductase family protein [Caldimonas sp.]
MNLDLDLLPERCDAIVVGAGPAGSAAARILAQGGREVVLVDAHAFPRDKICGDGLIPDAHRALARLGVLDAVMAEARQATSLGCIAPRGGRIDVPGRLSVLPRKRLDEIVCRAAVDAGARMFAPARFVAPLRDGAGRVVGARQQHGERSRDVRAPWLVLASGAQPQATIAAGLCERRTPSAIALRGYVENAAMTARIASLEVVWHKRLAPGYGWIFPCGNDVFNVGVGVAGSHTPGPDGRYATHSANLRKAFAAFQTVYRPARELVEGGRWLGEPGHELKGAPLRFSLVGARLEAPGVLVTGEAAGSTYAFTGEGIGKAMETGIHAAEAILGRAAGDTTSDADAVVRADYAARVLALKPRFDLYEQANRANEQPWLVDLLVWSARRSPRRLQRMAGVLEETHIPTDAGTVRGVLRRLVDWR